eukprot:15423906-Alexandrium_andersonii.AAC.1
MRRRLRESAVAGRFPRQSSILGPGRAGVRPVGLTRVFVWVLISCGDAWVVSGFAESPFLGFSGFAH